MNTKEAIKLLKSQMYSIEDLKNIYRLDSDMTSKEKKDFLESVTQNKEFKEVIDLLKRGEKFEKMWEEFSEYLNKEQDSLLKTNGTMIVIKVYKKWNELGQKYFPKEADNET